MSTHSGLKHAAEPAPLESKQYQIRVVITNQRVLKTRSKLVAVADIDMPVFHRIRNGERRRTVGASAGRAAVLRRAPSDSDCSGETASLSADSGDRVLRAAPPPPRLAKSRSRRRGSEWEVLEGLKDGQRFDRRPEVFNGYLHKKRKWPLKGWHKRFFVVDGGILVYARSPTDVARGRLHGSVDVGLSVISAKARRRRIDIDADEFIYHLRAKTPDVFRTWLNVLKAHRLYRQHLLTFGAREAAPKIHPPLEDIPPTDTSSHASNSTLENSPMSSSVEVLPTVSIQPVLSKGFSRKINCFDTNIPSSIYDKTSPFNVWCSKCDSNALMPLDFEPVDDKEYLIKKYMRYRSLCSMNCMTKLFRNDPDKSPMFLCGTEKQILTTELDFRSPIRTGSGVQSSLLYKYSFNSPTIPNTSKSSDSKAKLTCKRKRSVFSDRKNERTTALFFFARKDRYSRTSSPTDVHMRKSKKCTNLVKYRNLVDEPPLRKPLSRCMLLGKYNLKKNTSQHTRPCQINGEVQVEVEHKDQSLQDITAASEYDKITERLMVSVLELQKASNKIYTENEVKLYINHIVKELYDNKWNPNDSHPIKALFRSLLEYWLKNSSIENVKEAIKEVKSTDKQSNEHFTKNQQLSSAFVGNATKQTQINSIKDHKTCKIVNENKRCPKNRAQSFEKERRVQELERLLKNTVYICETVRSSQSKEHDIKITQKLIDNLGRLSNKYVSSNESNDNNSSTEFPKIQETLNHLISDTSIPRDIAKDFLGAYLDVLLHDSNIENTNSSSLSTDDSISKEVPVCDVQTESVVKKVSKSITTLNKIPDKNKFEEETQPIDPGQLYLKDILDKITTIFSKLKFPNITTSWKCNTKGKAAKSDAKIGHLEKDELGRPVKESLGKNLMSENCEDSSVVIDVSKYDLEHISMVSDPDIKGIMSINLKLKERPPNFGECRPTNLSLNFSGDNTKPLDVNSIDSISRKFNTSNPRLSFKNPYIDYCPMDVSDRDDLKPFLSSSDATSKAYCREVYGSETSSNISRQSSKANYLVQKSENDDTQSCYILSAFRRNSSAAKCQSQKKVLMRQCNGIVFRNRNNSPNQSPTKNFSELCIFENRAPKIIDEKFILLLLENLSLLSRTVPSLHKDINSLYLKLRRKHEKILKHSSNQGLGLLGQIYKDESKAPTDNNETPFDENECPDTNTVYIKNIINAAVNTSIGNLPMNDLYKDKCISAYVICKEIRDIDCQTDLIDVSKTLFTSKKGRMNDWPPLSPLKDFIKPKGGNRETIARKCNPISNSPKLYQKHYNSINNLSLIAQTSMMSVPSLEHIYTAENGSNPNWYEHLYAKGTVMKSIFDRNDSCVNFKLISSETVEDVKENYQIDDNQIKRELDKKANDERRPSLRTRQDPLKEIRLISPSFKVSTESQTDWRLFRCLKEKQRMEKDFKVYPLFVSNIYTTKSNTTINSNVVLENSDDLKTLYRCSSNPSYCSGLVSPTAPPLRGPQAGFVSGTPGGRLASWIIDSESSSLTYAHLLVRALGRLGSRHLYRESGGPLENASRELGQAQLSVQQLQRLLETLELHHQVHHDTDVSLEGASPNVKKDRRKFGLRKKKSNSKCASVELAPPLHIDQSGSHMALSTLTAPPSPGGGASSVPNSASSLPIACAAARPQSLPGAEALGAAAGPTSITSLTPDQQLREDFTVLAKDLLATLKGVVSTLVCERGRLRTAMDSAEATAPPSSTVVSALRTNLSSALQQNSELRSRLSRIHDASDLAEISSVNNSDPVTRQFQPSLSYSSSCVSASEFFDAEEHEEDRKTADLLPGDEAGVIELDGDSSSEAGSMSSEEGSASSDNSDGAMLSAEPISLRLNQNGIEPRAQTGWSRRACLPRPRPTPGGPSLWNLLYKNIGKDLSQISMPVTINEPLNMLQRLCEELEYSELLEAAASSTNAVERMALIAAFAVSAYAASAHRAASKPFNPLLHETYECVRDERGMRFLAEQVSHHPPISACHAEAPRWCFWQEARIKTKFWGKSMEFQPTGRVHVRLASTGDHYSWNKVTTCVHNLFGGQRWVDQYGDMHITCHGTDITCKLSFIKASSWSSSRHEVRGAVTAASSGSRLRLQGRWSEALYAGEPPSARCLWRPGAMPPDHELYYGFTRFAMELNEMEPGQREMLPHTDTRLRPDQRALELGDVEAAEQHKHELEQSQRERRRDAPDSPPAWFRKTMEGGDETWIFTGEYWKAREAGFSDNIAPRIW